MNVNEKEIRRLSDQIKMISLPKAETEPHKFHTISSPSIHLQTSYQTHSSLDIHSFLDLALIQYKLLTIPLEKSVSMGPKKDTKKDTKGGKGKGKEPKDTSDGDDKGKGKGLKAANSINVRHILVCIPFSTLGHCFPSEFCKLIFVAPTPPGLIDTK